MAQKNFVPRHRRNTGRAFNGRAHIDKLYDGHWERYRARFLSINPTCYACGNPATVVDHLRSHQGNVKLFEKLDNHIPLCVRCHNTVTTKFDRNFREGGSISEKIKWLNSRRIPGVGTNFRKVKVLNRYRE